MKRALVIASLLFGCLAGISTGQKPAPAADSPVPADSAPASRTNYDDPGFRLGEMGLSPSERAGREIWYKATAGNDRFHTYVFQQRVGVLIDWFRVLNSKERDDRFLAWGLINDPECCQPGTENCPAKSLEETYGFDYCPGDAELLKYVGKSGYRDPACDFADGALPAGDPHAKAKRQSSCDLAFGTSTGALGFRKFPNPRFDTEKWRKLNRGAASWDGYNARLSQSAGASDARVSHLADASLEPPFRIGMACGACHIAFDPANPPQDPAHPQWQNIRGAVGNQYIRISEVMVSGMPQDSLEWQVFSHARPGTSDTSAVPTDQINNPGTINALINIKQRPTFEEAIVKWRKSNACPVNESACWCEPGQDGKCWSKSEQTEKGIHHILKDGSDSTGAVEAIQRVYFNIGSCSEQCWVNHLTDLRQLDPDSRNFGQTPFGIGQCRRDCPNFRAIEDRLPNILDFLMSAEAHAMDLHVARANELKAKDTDARFDYNDLVEELEAEFGENAVARGRIVFAENCARCHSSVPEAEAGPFKNRDFRAVSGTTGLRQDWLGNDQLIPASEVGTFHCRALHSNHMKGHVWEGFASETRRAKSIDANLKENADGGRGYYRNVSLLNLWAHAPFMHNNALGPEVCGKPKNGKNDFYRSPYVTSEGDLLKSGAPECVEFDPSVQGRFALYKASMHDLLNPRQRVPKITKLDHDIVLDIGPKLWDGSNEKKIFGFDLTVPQGRNSGLLGNFQHKSFLVDLVLAKTQPSLLEDKMTKRLGEAEGRKLAGDMREVANEILADPASMLDAIRKRPHLATGIYSSCGADVENAGHRFGEDLPEQDKKALIAFLATL